MEYINIEKGYTKQDIQKIAETLKNNKIAILPTDTVYGIASLASSKTGVSKIYEVKKRSLKKPVNILVSNIGMIKEVTKKVTKEEEKIINKFYPGALTIIFEKNDKIPDIITKDLETVGIRIPKSKMLLDLINALRRTNSCNKL